MDLAIDRTVDFVLIAGDLYDGDWKDHNTGLFFVAQMSRLREADVPVVIIQGNHDAASKMTKSLKLPTNVEMLVPGKARTAKSKELKELGVALHGQSYKVADETTNLVVDYPAALPGMFNIGLLHTSLSGREGHERYAACSVDDLLAKGYDYWALGHVHQREIVRDNPPIVFPGNIQGRHIRERGAKGCMVVTVDDAGAVNTQFEPLDVFRWELCNVPTDGAEDGDVMLERFAAQLKKITAENQEMPLGVRVIVQGITAAHQQLLGEPGPLDQSDSQRGVGYDIRPRLD